MNFKNLFFYVLPKIMLRLMPTSRQDVRLGRKSLVMPGGSLSSVNVGAYSYCGYFCRITHSDIGSFCSIADRVVIGGGAHPIEHVSTSPVFHSGKNVLGTVFYSHTFETNKKTCVGSDVWLGIGVIVLAGASIGHGAVIGAGSVVTKDVPPYEVWAGNPARFIRKRFDGEVVSQLLASKWWEMDEAEVKELAHLFDSPKALVEWLDCK